MITPDRYASLGELLRDALIQFKSDVALIELNRKRQSASYTYLEFKRTADRLASALEHAGVNAGSRVAIIMSNQSKWLLSAYSILFRGGVIVPIDYKLSPEEQRALLQHATPNVLITEHASWRGLAGKTAVPTTFVSEVPEGAELAGAHRWEDANGPKPPTFVPRSRSDVATLVYSSGTGGAPKGCMLTHQNYLEQYRMLVELFPLEQGDRYFSILPTNHAIDFMCGFIVPLACGATVVHQRTLRPEFINHTLKNQRITHMAVVPLILEAFERRIQETLQERPELIQAAFGLVGALNAALTLDKPRRALSRRLLKPVHDAFGGHLKLLFCGGAFVDAKRAQYFYDLGLPVVIGYGLTEACTVLTVNDLNPFHGDTVGRPLRGVQIEIRNEDPETRVGEVWAKGPTVMQGYFRDEDQTAEVLVDGWLKTGDLGTIDAAGHLRLVGRRKNMIVTAGGKNIYPEDIESAFEDLPCEELAVFASGYIWPGEALAEEHLVVAVRDATSEFPRILATKNRRLPEHKRVAGYIAYDEAFPRTASMKVKRNELAIRLRSLDRNLVRSVAPVHSSASLPTGTREHPTSVLETGTVFKKRPRWSS